MSASPPEFKSRRQPMRHSQDFISRLEAARARRAEMLENTAAEPDPFVLREPVAVEPTPEPWRLALPDFKSGFTAACAFFGERIRVLKTLPLVNREDLKLLWAVPVLMFWGLVAVTLSKDEAAELERAAVPVQPAEAQLVSAAYAPAPKASQLRVASIPQSAVMLGAHTIELFGREGEEAPRLHMGPAISYEPPRPILAGLGLPPAQSALPFEPEAPAPRASDALEIVRSGSSEERPLRVFLPNGTEGVARAEILGVVARTLTPFISSRDVSFEISQSHIRVYHDADLEEAKRMADALGVLLRDMRTLEPKPPAGLIEVYIAGLPADVTTSDQARLEAGLSSAATQSLATRAAIDDVLQELAPAPQAPVAVQPGQTRIVRPVLIETSESAARRGLLERLFQSD